jgi:pyruvate formate lyase activating enzyme
MLLRPSNPDMLFGGYQPISLSDFPGRVAAILFTQGCNFRCPYCHNAELIPLCAHPDKTFGRKEALALIQSRQGLLEGVVITGGEPTIQPDLYDFLCELRTLSLKIKLDTNGSNPDCLARLLRDNLLDYVAMDIKAPECKYDLLSGSAVDYPSIQKSIALLAGSAIDCHFRTTFMQPLLNDDDIESIRTSLPENIRYIMQECK